MKSINVLVVTYNHEKYIARFLDSVLEQKEYGLNKIILCDDQSKDNNVQVISEYVKKYPEIVELHVNKTNLGVYGNFNHLLDVKGDADLYYIAAGDDALCSGFFEVIQKEIKEKNIDCKQRVIIGGDWKSINSNNGKERIYSNRKMVNYDYLSSLKIRNQIYGRSVLISKPAFDKYVKVPTNNGITFAELLFDIQPFKNAEYAYYVPYVGSIYYTQIGVSTKMSNEKTYRENVYAWDNFPKAENIYIKDTYFCKVKALKFKFFLKPTLSTFLCIIYYNIKSIDWKLGFEWKNFAILYWSIFKHLLGK
ncbi:MAG: glycosyltransferase [Acetatifactor sp.]